MKWPWSKDVDDARRQAQEAAAQHAHAEQQRLEAKVQSEDAKKVARVLRRELERNGYTEKLIESWGGSAR
ncbi:DUF7620 family protein [Prescottella equi]|uniref:DUF7620 family protein n=1 Tax=Rhodococcus hoagii TaxID=43767 RepID=UPI000A0FBAB0|nr:hypothetical protein [Prescottella equi]NKR90539.1 hypothetical protein [Prescottella equi]NKR95372.1 hypothetical protein [Prescottella equi]ORJ99881.1 hypothetical protein A6F58_00815 [Prescottella equi]